ncbi:hypothetical protein KGA66_14325 [Actinocrinis puniceicyclus]|uniref:HTH cro/C1-type domain-containing protein n=1 Tax=Actinocrinis puniceicyclus TaxID=977794 RepID=A0A8J7WQP7_9ACTN|nr:hypothetical protein [Actinocrinis puniceicyclus]MBS2964232.1 hypothetical protein [Actinocrinis puniceicyclus]
MSEKPADRSRRPARPPADGQAGEQAGDQAGERCDGQAGERSDSAPQQQRQQEQQKPQRSGPGVLAERIQYLFEHKRRPDGKRHSYREVLAAIEADGGPSMSVGYLSQLVTGVRTNPMLDAVQGLARFFQVPLSYFDAHEKTVETDERINLVDALRHAGAQEIAMRAVGLSPQSIEMVVSVIDHLRSLQGLPPAEPASGRIE